MSSQSNGPASGPPSLTASTVRKRGPTTIQGRARSARPLGRKPIDDALLEDRKRLRAAAEHGGVKGADVESVAESRASALAQLEELEHAELVRCRLARHHDVTANFGAHLTFRRRAVREEVIDGLLLRPAF